MKKWEINCDGWYPYCPYCKQESFYRTPVCINCGELLQYNEEDMEYLKKNNKPFYDEVMDKYARKVATNVLRESKGRPH